MMLICSIVNHQILFTKIINAKIFQYQSTKKFGKEIEIPKKKIQNYRSYG